MKKEKTLNRRRVGAFVSLALVGLIASVVVPVAQAQKTHTTAPNLTTWGFSLNLNQQGCMGRARDALRAAGLTLHNPTPSAFGGDNENLFAIITCAPCTTRLFVHIAVAGTPNRGDTYGTAKFLGDYMQTGRNPGGGGGTSSVAPQGGSNFGGAWTTTDSGYPGTLSVRQDGNRVSGTYILTTLNKNGRIEGTVTGKMLLFRWSLSDGRSGSGHMILSDDGRSFDGYWSETNDPYNKSGGHWFGQRR